MTRQLPILPYFLEADKESFCIMQDKTLQGNYIAHGHDYLEMELILEGHGKAWINNIEVELVPGILYLLSPSDYHRVEIDQPGRIISIHFRQNSISAIGFAELESAYVENLSPECFEAYRVRLVKLSEEGAAPGAYHEQKVFAITIEMMIELLRKGTIYSLSQPAKRFQNALNYIQEHYTDSNLSLSEVAKACYLSPNYFSSVFTQIVGCHFADYVLECRLQYACVLIKTTSKSITEIALESGFSSVPHFFRCFKKAFGCTPAKFRKEN